MKILWVGLDEAGYGPILGPLCVAAYASRREMAGPARDSKAIYRGGNISRLVARCRQLAGKIPLAEVLLDSVSGQGMEQEPWHLPPAEGDAMIANGPAVSGAGMSADAEIPGLQIRARAAGVAEFSQGLQRGNKADFLAELYRDVLLELFEKTAPEWHEAHVAFDRWGGRHRYAPILAAWGFEVHESDDGDKASRYTAFWRGRRLQIAFLVGGDRSEPAIAAASCFAKLAREVLMARFNAWWVRLLPGLLPTAGYYEDGLRFLAEIEECRARHNIPLRLLRRSR